MIIGIDPGVHVGFAVWSRTTKEFEKISTCSFWQCIAELDIMHEAYIDITVVIEDVTQNRPTFNRGVYGAVQNKISQNVGSNKRDCQLIIEWCEERGIKVVRLRPNKNSMTKKSAAYFRQQTGWTKKTSQHGRDAAFLVWQY